MLNLNLLPPEEQRALAYVMRRRAVAAAAGALAGALAVFAILLLPTLFALALQRADAVRATALERESQERLGIEAEAERIGEANRLAERAIEFDRTRQELFPLVTAAISAVAEPISIERMSLQPGRGLDITGRAPTRKDLLVFLEALEARGVFGEVSSPVSNLIRETNISFSISAALR